SSSITWATSTRSSESMSSDSNVASRVTSSGSGPSLAIASMMVVSTVSCVAAGIGVLLSVVGWGVGGRRSEVGSGGQPSVDCQGRSGHVAGFVACQKADACRDLVGCPGAASGHVLEKALLVDALGELGLHEARRHGVHGHAPAGHLGRDGASEPDESGLRRRIVR